MCIWCSSRLRQTITSSTSTCIVSRNQLLELLHCSLQHLLHHFQVMQCKLGRLGVRLLRVPLQPRLSGSHRQQQRTAGREHARGGGRGGGTREGGGGGRRGGPVSYT